jgi:hypothetical protein
MKDEPPPEPQAEPDDIEKPSPEAEETEVGWAPEEEPWAREEEPWAREEQPQDAANPPASNETKWIRWGVVIVGVLTLLVFIGLLISYLQLEDIRDSNAGTTQAVRDFAMLDERAWLEPVGIDASLVVGSPVSISLKVINRGKTPAKRCAALLYLRHLRYPALPDMSVVDSKITKQGATSLSIGPGDQIPLPSAATAEALSKSLFDSVQSGDTRMFILVKLTYDDLFKKHHWVECCYMFDPISSQWVTSGNSVSDD